MIVGIDLGTTNSAVALWRDGAAVMIPNALGDLLTPSAVGVGDDGAILIGMAARERQVTHPHASATAFKRYMGTRQQVRLGKRDYGAEELSALVLTQLKSDVEAWAAAQGIAEPVTGAVVTVPAYFNDRQRKATRRAATLAGLPVERLLNEPTAAALAYGLADREEKEPFLVFDLGGGTFDVSVVEMYEGIVEVRASAGDNRLGGEDYNEAVVEAAMPRLNLPAALLKGDADVRRQLLRAAAERCRRALTEADEAAFGLSFGGERYETTVTAAQFEAAAKPLLDRLREPVLRSLRDSGIRAEELSEIVLVGGSTRMPLVRRAATRMFGRFPGTAVHPDHAVVLGAAAQAGLLEQGRGLDEVRLTDVCPFTLGVSHAVSDGHGGWRSGVFSPIIERNTPVPVSRVEGYGTIADNQAHVAFDIYQGEARLVDGNVKLGSLKIPVPRGPAGQLVECRFSYDSSGLLEVDAHVPSTGTTRNLVIVDEDDAPSADEIERRRAALAGLKHHPREDAANAALLARAARCFEDFTGDRREAVGSWIAQYEAVLDSQDPRAIATAATQLTEALDQLEGERWL